MFQIDAELRAQFARRDWRVFKNRRNQLRAGQISKWPLPGAHLVEHGARRPHIGALIRPMTFDLLGRHIGQGAGIGVRIGERGRGRRLSLRLEQVGETEIQNLELTIGRDLDIARLQITVNDAYTMRSFETRGHLLAQLQNVAFRQRTASEFSFESQSRHKLRHKIIKALIVTEIKGHSDKGIGYFRKAEGFATKLPPRRFAKQRQLRQDLQRHIAIQLLIMCAKNHPHSASADVLNNAVTAKNLDNCGSGDRHERMVGWATTKVNIDTTDACEMLEYASAELESGREKYA